MAKNETTLNDLHTLVKLSEKTGVALTERQLKQVAEIEDDLIKNEVLPLLIENVEPVMRQIQRELTLVLNYKPNQPISLRVSRQSNLSDLDEALVLTPDDIPDLIKRGRQQRGKQKNPTQNLRVRMPDGSVIYNGTATETFCEVVERIGLVRVRNLGITQSGLNIVSTTKDPNRRQHEIDNLYVFTNMNTVTKKNVLDRIADGLQLNLTVEVIDK